MENNNTIKLGGFPPILFINQETKKKRAFKNLVNENSNFIAINNLNIMNIKNILNVKKINDSK